MGTRGAVLNGARVRRRLVHVGITGRIWTLNTLLGGGAGILYFGVVRHLPSLHGPLLAPWWALAALFFVAEIYVVHLQFRRDAHSFSLSEIPLVMGLFFVSPQGLIAAQLVGAALALTLHRRQSPLKLVFNLSHFCLEACVAVIAFHAFLSVGDPIGPSAWIATFVATLLATLIGVGAIFTAISMSESRLQLEKLPHTLGLGVIVSAVNTSLALVGVTILWKDPRALWLLAVPTATLFLAYRAYTAEREKHSSLEFLYETTRILHSSQEVEFGMIELLRRTRTMFRCELAEIVLLASDNDETARRTAVGPDGGTDVMKAMELHPIESMWAMGDGTALRFGGPIDDDAAFAYFERRGIRDAMVAPLQGETRVIGLMLIGNRLGQINTFDGEDLKLFETLANQASVSLEKGRLEQSLAQLTELEGQLKHQAFHDSLTGLANRALFTDRVEHAMERQGRLNKSVAVLFLDLDDFKTINDSLGHTAGDELLIAVAHRLHECLRPADTAARLGGDEFAILLEDMDHDEDAAYVAERIIQSLQSPFPLQGKEVMIRASIGIAVSSTQHRGTDALLRNADLAMYRAKSQGKGRYEVFRPSMHAAALQRLELKAELQKAVDAREFTIHYQPFVMLRNGLIAGAEALVRWEHPERGLVLPGDFIPLAEETGLIVPLGQWVLDQACAQARDWQKRYPSNPPMRVSVNLSGRQLQQAGLVDQVARTLSTTGLDAGSLILEITESVLMQDTESTIGKLQALKSLGVRLAIDDFGTGYSSLSYLRNFPIDILKIAKSFIDSVGSDLEESSLARAIIKLGGTLKLQTVAEGIELAEQRDRLRNLQCSMGQGYFFARPLTVEQMENVLSEAGMGRKWAPSPERSNGQLPLPIYAQRAELSRAVAQ